MNKQTRRLWRKLSWALATAGSLGLSAGVNAQSSPYHPNGAAVLLRNPMERSLPPTREPQTNREIEANVELAWLASPLTFPYPLEAHVVGSALEVKGQLPSRALHTEALRIAREESGMPVADSVKIYPDLTMTPTSKPAHVLSREVNDALAHVLPAALDHFSVSVWMRGQVMLKGSVKTHEEKLTASRCLRRIAGCSCVINQLNVSHSASLKFQATPAFEMQQVVFKDTEVKEVPVQPSSVNVMLPQSIKLDSAAAIPILPLPETAKITEKPIVQNPMEAPAATVSYGIIYEVEQDNNEKSLFAYHPTKWRKLDDNSVVGSKPVSILLKVETAEKPEAIAIVPVSTSQPAPPAVLPALKLAQATEPVCAQTQNAKQGAMKASDGIVFFDETETQAEIKAKPEAHGVQNQLQQLIAAACQKPVQEVEVVVVSETKLEVRVKARYSQECEELSTRIFQIPELTPYQVSLEIPLDK